MLDWSLIPFITWDSKEPTWVKILTSLGHETKGTMRLSYGYGQIRIYFKEKAGNRAEYVLKDHNVIRAVPVLQIQAVAFPEGLPPDTTGVLHAQVWELTMTTVRAETEVKPHAVCADTWLTYRASFQAGELAVQSLVYDVEQNEGRDFGVPKAWSVEAIQKYGDRSLCCVRAMRQRAVCAGRDRCGVSETCGGAARIRIDQNKMSGPFIPALWAAEMLKIFKEKITTKGSDHGLRHTRLD
jgi:hypothetical protein